MDGISKRPYTTHGTQRFASGRFARLCASRRRASHGSRTRVGRRRPILAPRRRFSTLPAGRLGPGKGRTAGSGSADSRPAGDPQRWLPCFSAIGKQDFPNIPEEIRHRVAHRVGRLVGDPYVHLGGSTGGRHQATMRSNVPSMTKDDTCLFGEACIRRRRSIMRSDG